jgi:NAD(P)-dependent dehydrogenase (short-subunit alcohol dehydrogenase family)
MADTAHRQRVEAMIPMGRLGMPEDFCGAALFLAGPESAYVTGTTVFVDGGRSSV